MTLAKFFYATGLAIMLGWLLRIGAAILIPIVWAVIAVYVLARAEQALGRLPGLARAPVWLRRVLVLAIFTVVIAALGLMVIANVYQIADSLPQYQKNLEAMVASLAATFGFDGTPSWETIRNATIGKLDFRALLLSVLGSIAGIGGTVFMIALYAMFLMSELGSFRRKTGIALGDQAGASLALVAQVNQRIGDYLATKTVINIILAGISYVLMKVLGIDFALFWAVLIGLMNYVPYVGSLLGVAFPVLLSLAQFGSLQTAIVAAVLLTAAQTFVGNFLEPRMVGRSVNLSAFIVLVALVVWSALWGIQGAILSVPLTSMMMIVFATHPETRKIAIYLSSDGDV